jgi:uncharacterized protein YndB with AHSA1/START domain
MNDYGEMIAKDAVRFVRRLPGPIERVWSYLVEGDKRKRWLCDGKTELHVGGNVELRFHNSSLSTEPDIAPPEKYRDLPEHVNFSGTVTACDPMRLLSHTWEYEGEASEVTFELVEDGADVILTLTQRRLTSREEVLGVCGGWHTHFDILEDVLTGRTPRAFWKRHTEMERRYEKRLVAKSGSE